MAGDTIASASRKHEGPTPVLTELRTLAQAQPTLPEVADVLAYLEKREALMQYPTFQVAGWPIGSGSVESANKLVVEARLKGSGMHWHRTSVTLMLALRKVACNDRWAEAGLPSPRLDVNKSHRGNTPAATSAAPFNVKPVRF